MFSFTRSSRLIVAGTFVAGLLVGIGGTVLASTMNGSSIFPDITAGSYDDAAIGQMYGLGIIKGYANGNFGPDDPVTRGQVAVMLQRFYNVINGVSNTPTPFSSSRSSVSSRSSSSSVSSSTSSALYGTVRFTTNTFAVTEGVNVAQVTVVRIGQPTGSVTVNYATGTGSAAAGKDYNPVSGTLTFSNGQTSKSFSVSILNNPLMQSSVQIPISLSAVSAGAALGSPSTAVINISTQSAANSSSSVATASSSSVNPAGTLSLAAGSYMMDEFKGSVTVTVNRVGGTTGTVTVAYGTTDSTAHSGADYTGVSGTLTFNPGDTSKTFNVPLFYNSNVTGSRMFNVTIGSPAGGATMGTTTTAQVTIFDHEAGAFGSGSLKFSKSEYDVTHTGGWAYITVQRVGGASGSVTVSYDTESVTASAGTDYVSQTGVITFAPGETSKTITIPLLNNGNLTSSRSFNVALTSPAAPATLVTPYVASVVIGN